MLVKISNSRTGLVLNRWGSATIKPAKGDAITLYEDKGSSDQRFDMAYDGDYVYFKLQSNPDLVINRHSENGRLMLWPLKESNKKDILFNTETVNSNTRLIMPYHYRYANAGVLLSYFLEKALLERIFTPTKKG